MEMAVSACITVRGPELLVRLVGHTMMVPPRVTDFQTTPPCALQ
jgi:hypothetical protein